MATIDRFLKIDIPKNQSAFLWGPRKTGKSTYLKQNFPDSIYYDFLKTDLLIEFSKRPSLLREQISAAEPAQLKSPVILDEVQKIPQILDEVHWLIENRGIQFILCGSSARKLRRGNTNLLGGRAWRYEMHPLASIEVSNFNLLRVLNHGLIPSHYLEENPKKSLKAYTHDYLKEEVFAEGLTRNIPAFSRFFESMGYSHGELINYLNIARECGVASKTVKEYYQILVDTLLGTFILPFKKRQHRQIIGKAPKFYLFDVGVAGILVRRELYEEKGKMFGKAFEHFLLMELLAHRSYLDLDYEINFWQTKTGLEVDFILANGEVAIEVKGTSSVDKRDFRPLYAFIDEYSPKKALFVCKENIRRIDEKITIIPYREFLSDLWDGKIIK